MIDRQVRICVFLLITIIFRAEVVLSQDQDNENTIHFRWDFAIAPSGASGSIVQKITRDTILHTGDDFKLFFNFQRSTFAYVIHKSPQDEISLLYPKSIDHNDESFITGKNIFIPEGNEWYKLDSNIGKETFHILVSTTRLDRLEDLLRLYSDENGHGKKKELVDAITMEIKDIKKKYRSFTQQPEKPVSIAGTVRGMDEKKTDKLRLDISTLADEVYAISSFCKTITIDHKP